MARFLILLTFLTLPSFLALTADAGEALVASEVDVDATGKDAADAREQAMTKGQLDGLMDLLSKLTTQEEVQRITTDMDANKVAAMVRGTEVLEEKISSNRYRAHLRISFDGSELSNLIGSGQSKNGAAEPNNVGAFLVIPGYEEEGTQMLWEDTNPWRATWKSAGLEASTGDIIVPFGDNADMGTVDALGLASANYASLIPLTVRYGVSDIIILQAKYVHKPDMTLNVVKRHVNRTVNEVNLLTYRADPQETKDMLLARAARDIADNIQHKKSEEMESTKTVMGGERNTMMMLASISTMASWTQLRTKLGSLPMVDRLEMLAIAPQQVDIIVHYRGTPESLANAITAQNIRLVKMPTYWVVSRD